jgi:hypothetical protein
METKKSEEWVLKGRIEVSEEGFLCCGATAVWENYKRHRQAEYT